MDNGSASLLLEDLLDAQDRLTDSEESLLQSTLEYSLAQVTYKKSIGALLSDNNIQMTRSCECNLPRQSAVQIAPPAMANGSVMTFGPNEFVPMNDATVVPMMESRPWPVEAPGEPLEDPSSPSDELPTPTLPAEEDFGGSLNLDSDSAMRTYQNPVPFDGSRSSSRFTSPQGTSDSTGATESQTQRNRFEEPMPLAEKIRFGQAAKSEPYSSKQ